ncbi:MAG TPA: STAS domain-containing protein [Steroidobacteraceae bacterium]|nr:STAS domain-containing protein [Steroidobacteraceae bacterium]
MNRAGQDVQIEAGPAGATVRGALTFQTARRACAAGIGVFAASTGALTVDLAAVAAADSAGLAVLIEWRRWAHLNGRRLGFANLPAAISGLAKLSELDGVLADAG